jgi:hypothetical protein
MGHVKYMTRKIENNNDHAQSGPETSRKLHQHSSDVWNPPSSIGPNRAIRAESLLELHCTLYSHAFRFHALLSPNTLAALFSPDSNICFLKVITSDEANNQ